MISGSSLGSHNHDRRIQISSSSTIKRPEAEDGHSLMLHHRSLFCCVASNVQMSPGLYNCGAKGPSADNLGGPLVSLRSRDLPPFEQVVEVTAGCKWVEATLLSGLVQRYLAFAGISSSRLA